MSQGMHGRACFPPGWIEGEVFRNKRDLDVRRKIEDVQGCPKRACICAVARFRGSVGRQTPRQAGAGCFNRIAGRGTL